MLHGSNLTSKIVQLHVMHSWGGGLERWVQDYCRTDTARTNIVLKSIGVPGLPGQRLALYQDIDDEQPTRIWELTSPINSTCVTNWEYRYALEEIINDFGVQAIIVSSFIGHSLDILDTGIETIVICHDFYPFCPAINIYFNKVCTECNFSHLQRCFKENQQNKFFPKASASQWIPIRKTFLYLILRYQITLIIPSNSVKDYLIQLDPAFKNANFVLIPHGVELQVNNLVNYKETIYTSKLKILILGRLTLHKGIDLLKEVCQEIIDVADIFLLGCGQEGRFFEGVSGIQIVAESYSLVDLPGIVEKISPQLGLLLSVAPETFAYTLSELMMLGIPIVATKVGSFEDRIQDGINGFLVSTDKNVIIHKIKELSQQRELLSKVAMHLRNMSHRTKQEMVDEYHKLIPLAAPSQYKNSGELNFLKMTHAELERVYAQVAKTQGDLQLTWDQLEQTRMELTYAKDRIAAMESSKFWQIRKAWFKFKRIIKLPDNES